MSDRIDELAGVVLQRLNRPTEPDIAIRTAEAAFSELTSLARRGERLEALVKKAFVLVDGCPSRGCQDAQDLLLAALDTEESDGPS